MQLANKTDQYVAFKVNNSSKIITWLVCVIASSVYDSKLCSSLILMYFQWNRSRQPIQKGIVLDRMLA